MALLIILGYLLTCAVIGRLGRDREIGSSKAFVLSLLLSPLIGAIFTATSPRRYEEEDPEYTPRMLDSTNSLKTCGQCAESINLKLKCADTVVINSTSGRWRKPWRRQKRSMRLVTGRAFPNSKPMRDCGPKGTLIQDKSGGFQCLIPLAFYPSGTALDSLPGPDAVDNLKTIAVSRLMLDNFDHIKAYWVMLGKATAQTALHFGANDLDGTITDGGELTHSYSVESGGEVKMAKQEIIEMIERAGFEAVERDTVYNRVEKVAA